MKNVAEAGPHAAHVSRKFFVFRRRPTLLHILVKAPGMVASWWCGGELARGRGREGVRGEWTVSAVSSLQAITGVGPKPRECGRCIAGVMTRAQSRVGCAQKSVRGASVQSASAQPRAPHSVSLGPHQSWKRRKRRRNSRCCQGLGTGSAHLLWSAERSLRVIYSPSDPPRTGCSIVAGNLPNGSSEGREQNPKSQR